MVTITLALVSDDIALIVIRFETPAIRCSLGSLYKHLAYIHCCYLVMGLGNSILNSQSGGPILSDRALGSKRMGHLDVHIIHHIYNEDVVSIFKTPIRLWNCPKQSRPTPTSIRGPCRSRHSWLHSVLVLMIMWIDNRRAICCQEVKSPEYSRRHLWGCAGESLASLHVWCSVPLVYARHIHSP